MPARTRLTVVAVVCVLLAGIAAAWLFEAGNGPTPAPVPGAGQGAGRGSGGAVSATMAPPPDYRVRVTRDGRDLASFDVAALTALGLRTVTLPDGTESGPQLLAVLQRAGATDVSSVTIIGTGERDSGLLVLAFADIGPDTVLDIAKRGTVKVAGPNIPHDKRVRDITEIQVR